MGTIYVLGAGFSRTCGIATDVEMLAKLNPLLKSEGGKTSIDHLRRQLFERRRNIGFELFMSTLSAQKFTSDYLDPKKNVFREEEREIRQALRDYLEGKVKRVNWRAEGKVILEFVGQVDWRSDYVVTFNYDLLLESAAAEAGVDVADRVLHLHGAVGESIWAWPTYIKFAYPMTKKPLAPRWKRAFELLRDQANIDRLIFIGYSMPSTDMEAKSLFNFADYYNQSPGAIPFFNGKLVPKDKRYTYKVVVVNPTKAVAANYRFFRKKIWFRKMTLEEWLANRRIQVTGG